MILMLQLIVIFWLRIFSDNLTQNDMNSPFPLVEKFVLHAGKKIWL